MVNRSEWNQWRQDAIYKELTDTIRANIGIVAGELVGRERSDSDRDQYLRGFVRGLTATLEWEPEFTTENEVVDEI